MSRGARRGLPPGPRHPPSMGQALPWGRVAGLLGEGSRLYSYLPRGQHHCPETTQPTTSPRQPPGVGGPCRPRHRAMPAPVRGHRRCRAGQARGGRGTRTPPWFPRARGGPRHPPMAAGTGLVPRGHPSLVLLGKARDQRQSPGLPPAPQDRAAASRQSLALGRVGWGSWGRVSLECCPETPAQSQPTPPSSGPHSPWRPGPAAVQTWWRPRGLTPGAEREDCRLSPRSAGSQGSVGGGKGSLSPSPRWALHPAPPIPMCPRLTEEDTEVQRGPGTRPESHSERNLVPSDALHGGH